MGVQREQWPGEDTCSCPSPLCLLGWSGGSKALVWDAVLFPGRQVLARLTKSTTKPVLIFPPLKGDLFPGKRQLCRAH